MKLTIETEPEKLLEFCEKYCPQYELFGKIYRSKRDLLQEHSRVSMMNILYDREQGEGLTQFIDWSEETGADYTKFYNHSGWKDLNKNITDADLMELAELIWDSYKEQNE